MPRRVKSICLDLVFLRLQHHSRPLRHLGVLHQHLGGQLPQPERHLSDLVRLSRLLAGQDLVLIEQHHRHPDFELARISSLVLTFPLAWIWALG